MVVLLTEKLFLLIDVVKYLKQFIMSTIFTFIYLYYNVYNYLFNHAVNNFSWTSLIINRSCGNRWLWNRLVSIWRLIWKKATFLTNRKYIIKRCNKRTKLLLTFKTFSILQWLQIKLFVTGNGTSGSSLFSSLPGYVATDCGCYGDDDYDD